MIQSVSRGRDTGLFFELVSVEGFRMERFFYSALIGAAFFATSSLGHAEDPGKKHHKYQKVQEWLSRLPQKPVDEFSFNDFKTAFESY